jgi:peroxiredoxin
MTKEQSSTRRLFTPAIRTLCILSALFLGSVAAAQTADIQIAVTGLSGGKARLLGSFAEQRFLIDSAVIDANGRAAFRRDSLYPQGLLYVLLPDNTSIPFMASEDQQFTLRTRQGALADAMAVEGSTDNELLYQNLRFENDFQKRYQAVAQALKALAPGSPAYDEQKRQSDELLEARRQHLQSFIREHPNTLFTRYKIAGQNPELRDVRKPDGAPDEQAQIARYRAEFWDNVNFSDARLLRTPVIFNKLKRYISELTPQHPDSLIAATDALVKRVLDKPEYYQFFVNWIALQYEPTKTTVMDGEAVYVHIIKQYITPERAFWTTPAEISALQRRADEMSASLLGRPGPNVTAPDPNGQLRSLLDLKAPYLVVFMYNPDCDHCIEETPRLIEFLKNRAERDVEVFGIALDTDAAAWKAFIARMGIPWVNVFDPTNRAIYAKYYVDITPELYVLNPERIIIGKNLKAAQIAEVIARDKARPRR